MTPTSPNPSQLYEPLFRLYNVDIVINGHDHDYERTGPVYNYSTDEECGAVSVVFWRGRLSPFSHNLT